MTINDSRYREVDEGSELVQWLWSILEGFSNAERVLFMRFVSGRSRLPANLADLSQRFQVCVETSVIILTNYTNVFASSGDESGPSPRWSPHSTDVLLPIEVALVQQSGKSHAC